MRGIVPEHARARALHDEIVPSPLPMFNTRYVVEVTTNSSCTDNLVPSGTQSNVAVAPNGPASAQWTMPKADWDNIRYNP